MGRGRRGKPYVTPRKENPTPIKNDEPSEDQNNHSVAKAVATLEDTIAKKADASRDQTHREDRGSKLIEIATLLFVILTTVGIFYQARILNSSDEAIHQSADAAKDAADAAKSSVETTKKIMRIDQRAWIGLDYIEAIPNNLEAGKSIGTRIGIKNTGKTPARNIVIYSLLEPANTGKPLNFSYKDITPIRGGFLSPRAIAESW
jgi:hypothetical protein